MISTSTTDEVMMFWIVTSMAIFDAFSTLLSILKKGIFVDQKSLLMQKTNRKLRTMLVGGEKNIQTEQNAIAWVSALEFLDF